MGSAVDRPGRDYIGQGKPIAQIGRASCRERVSTVV